MSFEETMPNRHRPNHQTLERSGHPLLAESTLASRPPTDISSYQDERNTGGVETQKIEGSSAIREIGGFRLVSGLAELGASTARRSLVVARRLPKFGAPLSGAEVSRLTRKPCNWAENGHIGKWARTALQFVRRLWTVYATSFARLRPQIMLASCLSPPGPGQWVSRLIQPW